MHKCYQSFLIFFFALMLFTNSKGQEKKLLITTTYYNSDEYKLVSFIGDRMNIVKEEYYYVPTNSKVAIIEYDNLQKIQKFVAIDKKKIILVIDHKAGKYSDFESEVYLNFKGIFQFEGIQKSRQVICNYKNGRREGSYIQIDSAVSGKKLVTVKRPNIYLLQKNIIAYSDDIEERDSYKKFESIHLNFNNNLLNGIQKGLFNSGSTKFISDYKKGILLEHISYEKDQTVNAKISTVGGVSNGKYIKNGQIINDLSLKIFYIPELVGAGEILHVKFRDKRTTNYDADEEELPEREDLEEIEIHYAGSEEKEMIEKIMKDKNIFRYYISTIRSLPYGDYKIYYEKIKKYKIGDYDFCKDLYILENNTLSRDLNFKTDFEKNILNSFNEDSSVFKISIYPKFDKEKTQQIVTFLNIAKSLYSSNSTKLISSSEDFKYLYDSTKVYTAQALNHKFATNFLDINNFTLICFKKDNLKYVIERPNQFYVVDMFGQKTIFEYSLIQYPYLKINVKISQIKVVDSSLIFEITKQVEF